MRSQNIIISSTDRDRLLKLIDSARLDRRIAWQNIEALERELVRATITSPEELPRSVVALNSTVWLRDLDTEELERYMLVLPHEADVVRQRISVLAPIGTAILGYRLRDIIEWPVPQGKSRLEIVKVSQAKVGCEADTEGLLV
ncbi:Regulator of nucleoside diphosphate kinase [Anatilimnocola aggregata]|uniref:Regulator of nucleoside diphosphate kinase n=1 Tax=Anatilimnocola aggregata TaxID=2528021 RepID=A0A517Y940_9BACT|nr:GreA/GreB family elongation factor [Anatilimnocola aggregata]QDU26750.1 Regulator of nucleoside diphosphate kinase [Anatilimnocola aggregata]